MNISELLAMLKGKGFKVQHNEGDQTFDVEPPAEPVTTSPAPAPAAVQNQLTQNEMEAIRGFINLTADFGGPDGFKKLLLAMKDVAPVVQNAQAAEAATRSNLVASIKTNSSLFADEDLDGMTIPQLTKLNAQVTVNFAGAGGAFSQQNAAEPLGLPSTYASQKEK